MNAIEIIQKTATQLKDEGWFAKVEAGDQRAASLFARLVAFKINPSGDPKQAGWLRKGGGENVDGYAEDAIVWDSDPNNLENVIDLVGGAGAPGARLTASNFVERRKSDVWEAPRPLLQIQLEYLKPGGQPPVEPDLPTPEGSIFEEMKALREQLACFVALAQSLETKQVRLSDQIQDTNNKVSDVRNALSNGIAIQAKGNIRFVGDLNITGVAKG